MPESFYDRDTLVRCDQQAGQLRRRAARGGTPDASAPLAPLSQAAA